MNGFTKIQSHVENYELGFDETGSVHTNLGATCPVTLGLPECSPEGTTFTFAVQANQELFIFPNNSAIRDDSGCTKRVSKWANAIGECISLVADENGDWVTISKRGIWVESE